MTHANALLTPRGRLALARCVVDDRWTLQRAAERFQTSATTAKRWADRYRELGEAGMVDRSSRPHRSPRRTPQRRERRIIGLRVARRWGPARIGFHLGLHPSTVHRVLSRWGLTRLRWLDRPTGRVIRRYEHAAPGDLIHVDVKKLGKIPDGGGWRKVGRMSGRKNRGSVLRGFHFLHTAVDDHSRLAYAEILGDERKETAAAFWARDACHFANAGAAPKRVLTDNGSCYRSSVFAAALTATNTVHKRTRPYRPQTNGKVERFHRTWPTSGPTPVSTAPTPTTCDSSSTGSTPTTTTAATPRSAASRQQHASPTCQDRTASSPCRAGLTARRRRRLPGARRLTPRSVRRAWAVSLRASAGHLPHGAASLQAWQRRVGGVRGAVMASLPDEAGEAVDRWFRDHSGQVLAYLLHRTDPDTAHDVLQDVFVVACRKWQDIPEPPIGWLFGAARRLLANKRRGLRRRDNLVQRIAELAALQTDQRLAAEQSSLADLLDGMSATDREVLTLSSWYDLAPADAAAALGCSLNSYNVRLHRARRRLAERLTAGMAPIALTLLSEVPR